jgi:hypothetical protein
LVCLFSDYPSVFISKGFFYKRICFDAINKRELELGAATMASLMYLIDQNGIEKRKENQ